MTLPMTERLLEVCRHAGGNAELELFPGVGHGFGQFPGEAADRCIAGTRAFIARQLDAG